MQPRSRRELRINGLTAHSYNEAQSFWNELFRLRGDLASPSPEMGQPSRSSLQVKLRRTLSRLASKSSALKILLCSTKPLPRERRLL